MVFRVLSDFLGLESHITWKRKFSIISGMLRDQFLPLMLAQGYCMQNYKFLKFGFDPRGHMTL